MFNRSDNFKLNAMPSDFDNLWEHCHSGDYQSYYKIYDRVMKPKFENSLNYERVPLRIYVRGNAYHTSRALPAVLSLKDAVFQTFPNILDEAGNVKDKFKNVDASVNSIPLSGEARLQELYMMFANPDGYLYITLKF